MSGTPAFVLNGRLDILAANQLGLRAVLADVRRPGQAPTSPGALGGEPRLHRAALIARTADLLAAEGQERRKTVVLVVDEAHLLAKEQLEGRSAGG
jgi:hypothetical protein